MRRILFVDDQPEVLEGLNLALRHKRDTWQTYYAHSAAEALDLLARINVDVVVADLKMPIVDGVQLLREVRERYPAVIRLILSGYADYDLAVRAAPVAHQYLTKPCEPESMCAAIDRAYDLRALLDEQSVREAVGRIDNLPLLPETYRALVSLLANVETTREQVAALVERDGALCIKLMQLVRSSFLGITQPVAGIKEAVAYLGTHTIKSLVLGLEVLDGSPAPLVTAGLSLSSFRAHAVLTGEIARRLLPDPHEAEDALLAGLLHDIGELILALRLPASYQEVTASLWTRGGPLAARERELGKVTHAQIGAYLLGLWGLPYPVVEAVAHHHEPVCGTPPRLDVIGAVHIADALAREVAKAADDELHRHEAIIDESYIAALGCAARLPQWRAMAAGLAKDSP